MLSHRAESSAHLYLLFSTVSQSWASILKLIVVPSGLELAILLPHPPEQLRSQTSAWDGRSAPFCTCQRPQFRILSSGLLSAGPRGWTTLAWNLDDCGKAGGEYSLLLVGLGQRTGDKMEGRVGVKRMFLEVRLGDDRVERRGSVEDRDVSEKTGKGVW